MIDRLKLSMRTMQMLTRAQEVIANNLANINTPGYKGEKLFYHAFTSVVNGKKVENVYANQTVQMQQGRLESTGNPYDLAIEGNGFFQIDKNGQMMLTRNGRFHVDSSGFLRDFYDGLVEGDSGPIQIPGFGQNGNGAGKMDKIEIAKDGTVRLNDRILDKIKLVKVSNVSLLKRMSGTYFKAESGNDIEVDTTSQVNQGYYEGSNVSPLKEMVKMTKNLQLFESQQRVMKSNEEALSQATTKLGQF